MPRNLIAEINRANRAHYTAQQETHDAILAAETPNSVWPVSFKTDLGKVWTGDAILRALDALPAEERAETLQAIAAKYPGMATTGVGTPASTGVTGDASLRHLDADAQLGMTRIAAMNAAAKSFYRR